jgi:hypothetical protein
VSKSANFTEAKALPGSYDGETVRAEMTAFPGESGPLPDNTRYWVWVVADGPKGKTPPSPAANKKTSAPVWPYFYDQYLYTQDAATPGSPAQTAPSYHDIGLTGGDYYRFTPTSVKYSFGTGGSYIGDILYHETWDLGTNGDNGPFPNSLKDNANCLGFPAGVFIIKYRAGYEPGWAKEHAQGRWYSAVYYWGMGTKKPDDPIFGARAGKVECDIVNQWRGYAETLTYEEALDRFTCEDVRLFLGLDPEPYYKNFATQHDNEYWPGESAYTPPAP